MRNRAITCSRLSFARIALEGAQFLVLVALVSSATFSATPVLKELQPWGAQRGKSFTLTLIGSNLAEGSKIISTLPASFTPLTPLDRDKVRGAENKLLFLVELKADAQVGLYTIRVRSPEGLSNILLFSVGVFPEYTEKESEAIIHKPTNDSLEGSEFVEIPVTINGTLRGPDRDVYRFHAKKEERLVLEVEARRAGSALDPVIQLLDSQGKQIAMNNDAPGLGLDCRLDVSFPADGDYYVIVHDAQFSNQDRNFYRLKIGSFTYADGLFPLGWKRGEKTKVQMFGGNLPKPIEVTVDLTQIDSKQDFTTISVPGAPGSLPFLFALSDLPEILEPSGQQVIPLPTSTVVNGLISKPDEVDRYKLAVAPGENWMIELKAMELGTSRLFGLLTVYDEKGKALTSAGDDIPDPDAFALIAPGRTSSDPWISFKVPEGVHEVFITVEDLVQRGGPLFGYRLVARKHPGDFTLALTTPQVNVPAGGSAAVAVTVDRRGYMGPIQLSISDAGDVFTVEGGYIPPEVVSGGTRIISRRGVLTITAKEGNSPKVVELAVWGEAVYDGTVIRRRARGPGLITEVLGGTGVPDPNRSDRQKPFVVPWLGLDLPTMVTGEIPAKLVIQSSRSIRLAQGMQYELEWRFLSEDRSVRPPRRLAFDVAGARLVNVVPKDQKAEYVKNGVALIRTLFGTPPQKFNLVLRGDIEIGGSTETIYSTAITVEIVQGYEILLPSGSFILQPGGKVEILGRLQREPAFLNAVTLEVKDLPRGVSCHPVDVPPGKEEFRLVLAAEASAPTGEYEVQMASSSTMVGAGMEKAVPYNIPPVKARLVVSATEKAEKVIQQER